MNLTQFFNTFQSGFQQNNRFACRIYPSGKLRDRLLARSDRLLGYGRPSTPVALDWLLRGLICSTSQLPDRGFDQVDQIMYGLTEKIPIKSEFTALDCNFLLPLWNRTNPVLEFFSDWQNVIQNLSTGLGELSTRDLTWPENYWAELWVTAYGRDGYPNICYKFDRVYPKTVQAVQMSWQQESELAQLSVAFTFSTWTIVPSPETGVPPLDPITLGARFNFGPVSVGGILSI